MALRVSMQISLFIYSVGICSPEVLYRRTESSQRSLWTVFFTWTERLFCTLFVVFTGYSPSTPFYRKFFLGRRPKCFLNDRKKLYQFGQKCRNRKCRRMKTVASSFLDINPSRCLWISFGPDGRGNRLLLVDVQYFKNTCVAGGFRKKSEQFIA